MCRVAGVVTWGEAGDVEESQGEEDGGVGGILRSLFFGGRMDHSQIIKSALSYAIFF